jgi:hypothetical protein
MIALVNHELSLKILSSLPKRISCPIEFDFEMENNTFSSTTYLIRTSRQLNSELDNEKFITILEASQSKKIF